MASSSAARSMKYFRSPPPPTNMSSPSATTASPAPSYSTALASGLGTTYDEATSTSFYLSPGRHVASPIGVPPYWTPGPLCSAQSFPVPRSRLLPTGSSATPVRLLLCGDVRGRFSVLNGHLETISRKQGPFAFVLCMGCFFEAGTTYDPRRPSQGEFQDTKDPNLPFLLGTNNFYVPVLFVDSSDTVTGSILRTQCSSGIQFSHSLEFLGDFGIKSIAGLTVGYLSGRYNVSWFFRASDEAEMGDAPIDTGDSEIDEQRNPIHARSSAISNGSTDSSPIGPSPRPGVDQQSTSHRVTSSLAPCLSKNGDPCERRPKQGAVYFGGNEFNSFYHQNVLQMFKESFSPYVGLVDVFVSSEWPMGVDTDLSDVDKASFQSAVEFGQQQRSGGPRDTVTAAAPSPSPTSEAVLCDDVPLPRVEPPAAPAATACFLNPTESPVVLATNCGTNYTDICAPATGGSDTGASCGRNTTIGCSIVPQVPRINLVDEDCRPKPPATAEATPTHVEFRISPPCGDPSQQPFEYSSPAVSELVEYLEPRYHVASAAGVFYHRPPFLTSSRGQISKFIGLAKLSEIRSKGAAGNSNHLKFVHALILSPAVIVAPRSGPAALASSEGSNIKISFRSPYYQLYNSRATQQQKLHDSPVDSGTLSSSWPPGPPTLPFPGSAPVAVQASLDPSSPTSLALSSLQRSVTEFCEWTHAGQKRSRDVLPPSTVVLDNSLAEGRQQQQFYSTTGDSGSAPCATECSTKLGDLSMQAQPTTYPSTLATTAKDPYGIELEETSDASEGSKRPRVMEESTSSSEVSNLPIHGTPPSTLSKRQSPPGSSASQQQPSSIIRPGKSDNVPGSLSGHELFSKTYTPPPPSSSRPQLEGGSFQSNRHVVAARRPSHPGSSPTEAPFTPAPSISTLLPADTAAVVVSNIPFDVDSNSLLTAMRHFGEVIDFKMFSPPGPNRLGKARIAFRSPCGADNAVRLSENLECGGLLLRIEHYRPDDERTTPTSRISFGAPEPPSYSESPPKRDTSVLAEASLPESPKSNCNKRDLPHTQAIDVRPHKDCWFCLANSNCEKRLIVATGTKSYVALAKGGIVNQHVLVIPVTHFPNFVFCPPDVGAELEKFIATLRACYHNQGMSAVVYERYVPMRNTTGMHMQLQMVPIPRSCSRRCADVFRTRAARRGISFSVFEPGETISALRQRVPDHIHQPYLYVELPNSSEPAAAASVCHRDLEPVERWLFTSSPSEGLKLPFNFGREAIAEIIGLPQRVDWRKCVEPEVVETRLAQQMQRRLYPFAPPS